MSQADLPTWSFPPEYLQLRESEAHVWRFYLDLPSDEVSRMDALLPSEELQRADRFRFKTDKDRYIARRGFLRNVLGRYLDIPPAQVNYSYNTFGKPLLANDDGSQKLRFNLAHSSGLALIAVTRGREIGVDIEQIRNDVEIEPLAERLFSESERDNLRSINKRGKLRAFFTCWTRKEAYLKARGEGLSFPLDQFTVSFLPGEPPRLLTVKNNPSEVERWTLFHLEPSPGYAAALAVEGVLQQLKCWTG